MNTAPNHFLHSEGAGGALPTLTTRKMLPIRQNLNRLTSINRTLRAVLIEVVQIAETGAHGAFTADNAHLSDQIGGTTRTITRALAELQRLGLVVATGATKLRRISPTDLLRRCYTGTEAEQFAFVEELNNSLSNSKEYKMSIDILPTIDTLSIDKQGSVYRQTEQCLETSVVVSIDKQGSVYKENNREQQNNSNNNGGGVARIASALAAAEKKIQELEAEKTALQAEVEKVTTQRDQLRNSLLAQRPASQAGGAGRRMDFADSPYATEAGFRELAGKINCAQACAAYYLPDMRTKAEGMEQRDEAGWKNWVMSWLKRERDSATGVVTQLPTPTVAGGSDALRRMNQASSAADLLLSGAITSTSLNR